MQSNHPKRVENYTGAALVMLGVNLVWIFAVVWAVFGLAAALCLAWLLNLAITRLGQRRPARG